MDTVFPGEASMSLVSERISPQIGVFMFVICRMVSFPVPPRRAVCDKGVLRTWETIADFDSKAR